MFLLMQILISCFCMCNYSCLRLDMADLLIFDSFFLFCIILLSSSGTFSGFSTGWSSWLFLWDLHWLVHSVVPPLLHLLVGALGGPLVCALVGPVVQLLIHSLAGPLVYLPVSPLLGPLVGHLVHARGYSSFWNFGLDSFILCSHWSSDG